MTYEEIEIELSDDIKAIMSENIQQKQEDIEINVKSCKECRYYDEYWNHGGELHCCGQDYDTPIVSREINDLYENCQINHQYNGVRRYIKRYGIVHHKPSRYHTGCISVVDFKDTHFESDGYNPDVVYDSLMNFFYRNEEEAERMMELAVQHYRELNLDNEYCKKRCFG